MKHINDREINIGILIVVEIGLGDLTVCFTQMREHLKEGDLPESQYIILKFLEEVAWGVCDLLVSQGFSHIML